MTERTRCLFIGNSGPYMCTDEDIEFWESLNPFRSHELRLMEILQEDSSRDLREAMKEATSA